MINDAMVEALIKRVEQLEVKQKTFEDYMTNMLFERCSGQVSCSNGTGSLYDMADFIATFMTPVYADIQVFDKFIDDITDGVIDINALDIDKLRTSILYGIEAETGAKQYPMVDYATSKPFIFEGLVTDASIFGVYYESFAQIGTQEFYSPNPPTRIYLDSDSVYKYFEKKVDQK